MTLFNNIKNTTLKFIDIGFIYTLSFVIGFIVVICLEKLFGEFDPAKNPSLIIVIFELIGILWVYGIVIYIINKFIYSIPFPFHGVHGYNHHDFIEELGGWMVEYIILFWYFAQSIQNRIIYIHNKLMGSTLPYHSYKQKPIS